MVTVSQTQAFADRLRRALAAAGVRPSPTVVANEFNLRHWGRSITPHTARNWLLGQALPKGLEGFAAVIGAGDDQAAICRVAFGIGKRRHKPGS